MTESKKAWVTPELIVLVRSQPEEAVLGQCKASNWDLWSGPTHAFAGCGGGLCGAVCEVEAAS